MIKIELFGELRVWRGSERVVGFRYEKVKALLALLVSNRNRSIKREKLAGILWPDLSSEDGRRNLRIAFSQLKAVLFEPDFFIANKHEIAFSPNEGCFLDLDAFESAPLVCRSNEDAEAMARALDCYRGPFAAGLTLPDNSEFEGWLEERREAGCRRALGLAEELERYYCAENLPELSLKFAERAVEINRHSEAAQFRLISLLADQGRIAAACAQHQAFIRILTEELGVEPGEKLLSLKERFLAPERTELPSTAEARDLRRVAILYAEIHTGSSDLEEAASELDSIHEEAMQIVSAQGGYYTRQGADLLAYFGYPRASEKSVFEAANAALSLLEAFGKRIRVALHCGEIITGNEARHPDLAGLASKSAARLIFFAAPGEAILSEEANLLVSRKLLTGSVADGIFRLHSERKTEACLTPFVGCESEIELLASLWPDACRGNLQAVLIRGEAGVGKSRLVQNFALRTGCKFQTLHCDQEAKTVPLYPFAKLLADEARLDDESSGRGKLEKLRAWVESNPAIPDDRLPLLANFLSLPGMEGHESLQKPAQQLRRVLEDSLLDLFCRHSGSESRLLVIEDLHWADPSSLAFIERLLGETASSLMLIVTSRHSSPWPVREIELAGLSAADSRSMLEALLGDIAAANADRIVELSDGIPLYIEELARMLDSGTVPDSVPATLYDLLAARFETVGSARPFAQAAASIGREFSSHLLNCLFPGREGEIAQALGNLQNLGLIRESGKGKYEWKHALLQETAYRSQRRAARQDVHGAIARAILKEFPEAVTTEPTLLARHFGSAGEAAEAVKHWLEACRQAISGAANLEAIAHAEAGIALLPTIDPACREKTELSLRIEQGTALLAVTGYGSHEVAKVFERARILLSPEADAGQLFRVLWGIWMGSSSHLGYQQSLTIALELEQAAGSPDFAAAAGYAMGNSLFWLARFAEAQQHFEAAIASGDDHRTSILLFGEDPIVTSLAFLSWTNWYRGDQVAALQASEKSLRLADELGHPHSLGYALTFAAVLHKLLGNPSRVAELSGKLLILGAEHRLPLWSAAGAAYLGWSRAVSGDAAGLEMTRMTLEGMKKAMVSVKVDFLAPLIEGCLAHGKFDEALELVWEGNKAVSELSDLHYAAELYRLEGQCLLGLGRRKQAESRFRDAYELALAQGAVPFMLRARADLEGLHETGEAHNKYAANGLPA